MVSINTWGIALILQLTLQENEVLFSFEIVYGTRILGTKTDMIIRNSNKTTYHDFVTLCYNLPDSGEVGAQHCLYILKHDQNPGLDQHAIDILPNQTSNLL